jgi:hypothetical protein
MPGMTVRFKIGEDNADPMTNRKDWWGWNEFSPANLGAPFIAIVRDTAVSNNILIRYEDDPVTGIHDDDTGFTPAVNTYYVATLIVLAQSPGAYLFRIGTTIEWKDSDTIIHQTSLQGNGDLKDRSGINWHFSAGCTTLDTVTKDNWTDWCELFATQDYDASLGLGD